MTDRPPDKVILADLIPTMEGWLTPDRAVEMYDLTVQLQPDYMVEIGVFGGRSLIAQALALRANGKGKIIGIDPWKKQDAIAAQGEDGIAQAWWNDLDYYKLHQGCMDIIWRLELDAFVNIIRAKSEHCYDIMPPIDVLYIDGGHSEEISCRDVDLFLPKVKQNGWIWFDDCDWSTTQKALAKLDAACKRVRDCGSYRLYCKY